MMKATLTSGALLWLCAAPSWAQAPTAEQPTTRKQIIEEMVVAGSAAARTGAVPRPFQSRLGTGGRGEIAAYLMAVHRDRQGYNTLLQSLEARATKQMGSTPANKGTTSVALKGLAPKILGLAVEQGAIIREVSGTTLTFRATPTGIVKALQSNGLFEMYSDYSRSSLQRLASRVSLAASFDVSKGPSAGAFAADEHQLANWSVRSEIVNHRDPAAPAYAELWNGLSSTSGPYTAAAMAVDAQFSAWSEYVVWEQAVLADIARLVEMPLATDRNLGAAGDRFRTLLDKAMPKLEKLPNMPAPMLAALDGYVAQLTTLQGALDDVYGFVEKGDLVTLDWSTARDPALPDLYTVTGVWEHALGAARRNDLTVNAAVNFFRREPMPGAHQLKSLDLVAELEHPLGAVLALPPSTLSVAVRFSHLPNDTVAGAPAIGTAPTSGSTASVAAPAPKGNIGVFQLKLTIPVKNSGVKIPLSITASNRTELIKEKDVRANFGVSFDLDTLVGGLFRRP